LPKEILFSVANRNTKITAPIFLLRKTSNWLKRKMMERKKDTTLCEYVETNF